MPRSARSSSPIVSPTARRMTPHRAPEVPPALSDHASPAWMRTVPAPAPCSAALVAASRAAPGSTLHPDAVVAVAGDLVEPAELVDVRVDDVGGGSDGSGASPGATR